MRPSARLRTVQDLLETFFSDPSKPLDVLAGKHFRTNRYIGAKDRRAIQETLYHVIRDYLALAWKAGALGFDANPKAVLLLHLVETGAFEVDLFTGEQYGLAPLGEGELALVKTARETKKQPPEWAKLNCPEWLYPEFFERFGDKNSKVGRSLFLRIFFFSRNNFRD